MKIRLALITACLTALAALAAGAPATAQTNDEPVSQQRAHQMMTRDADASAQAATDMSYGGTADTHSAAGHRTGKMCWPRSECDIFTGH
ncbi:hypothetical protein LMG28688_03550 [Paraburkholderia caffeinitolerans]|uniref:Lipoprotein n=1 Tax=Paraburkholderia caffeinitolerans TaxID=1723730 RepID=A0A6J5G5M6_9BURK|nr:hypothetical protein [Paraburkholderia caffeinitolerans]CAB3792596.1 hypothetical protein LMG28688_03550 [Paraburkholderia caffeinitolerans]